MATIPQGFQGDQRIKAMQSRIRASISEYWEHIRGVLERLLLETSPGVASRGDRAPHPDAPPQMDAATRHVAERSAPQLPLHTLRFTPHLRVFAVRLLAGMLLIGYAIMFAGIWPRVGLDWNEFFYPYSVAVLHGQNPFALNHGLFVPWVLAFTVPFAALPPRLGVAFFFFFTVASYAFIAHRMGAKEIALIAFMFSPPVSTQLLILNVDVFVFWGFVLPPPLALLLLLIKPQVGGVFALYLLLEQWRMGGWRRLLLNIAPTVIVIGLSFLLFGNWPAYQYSTFVNVLRQSANTSLFPISLVAGIPLLVVALWKRRRRPAISAAVLCSPYVTLPSWGAGLLACLPNDRLTVAAVVATMILRVTLWRGL